MRSQVTCNQAHRTTYGSVNDAEAVVTSLAIPISSGGNYVQYAASRSQYPPPTGTTHPFHVYECARIRIHVQSARRGVCGHVHTYTRTAWDSFASGFRYGNGFAVIGSAARANWAEAWASAGLISVPRYRMTVILCPACGISGQRAAIIR